MRIVSAVSLEEPCLLRYTSRGADTFMQCLEEFVGVIEPRLLQRTPMILQQLFDSEVLSEEVDLSILARRV